MDAGNRGRDAENRACDYLLGKGLTLLRRNYRSRRGEIDLVLRDTDSLVFVEVRYRRQAGFGSAAESIDRQKQTRLTACAKQYLHDFPQVASLSCRFDVVAIDGPDYSIEWIKDAFGVVE